MIISLIALWWAFRDIDWVAFKTALMAADSGLILLASAVLIIAVPLRGYRWGIFLRPIKKISVRLTSEATVVGYFGNNVLPFRLGEVVRSYFLSKEAHIPMSQVVGTVIVERLVDGVSILLILAFLPLTGTIPEVLRVPVLWGVALALIVGLVTFLIVRRREVPFLPGRFKTLADNLQLGFTSLRHGRHYLPLLITTVLIWFIFLISVHLGQLGLGLGLSLGQSYLLLVATSLVIAIPAAPGFVGTFHAAVILVLVNIFGGDLAEAQAAAVVLHAVGFIPYSIVGAVIYVRFHLHLRDVKDIKVEPDQGATR